MAASRMALAVREVVNRYPPYAVGTVGSVDVKPNSRNTIPGRVFFSVDFRHPEDNRLSAMKAELEKAVSEVAAATNVEIECEEIWYQPPIAFDKNCVAAVAGGAEAAGYAAMDIISGAGHDACNISEIAPTGMIFIPCEDGISHNEVENATQGDVAAGCNVLLRAIVARANALD